MIKIYRLQVASIIADVHNVNATTMCTNLKLRSAQIEYIENYNVHKLNRRLHIENAVLLWRAFAIFLPAPFFLYSRALFEPQNYIDIEVSERFFTQFAQNDIDRAVSRRFFPNLHFLQTCALPQTDSF